MLTVTELAITFSGPVGLEVLRELSEEVYLAPDGMSVAWEYPLGAAPSMILRALAGWLDEHEVEVDVVNLDVN